MTEELSKDPYLSLSRYEKCQVISNRSYEITRGSKVKLSADEIKKIGNDPMLLAEREFDKKLIRISIKRRSGEILNL